MRRLLFSECLITLTSIAAFYIPYSVITARPKTVPFLTSGLNLPSDPKITLIYFSLLFSGVCVLMLASLASGADENKPFPKPFTGASPTAVLTLIVAAFSINPNAKNLPGNALFAVLVVICVIIAFIIFIGIKYAKLANVSAKTVFISYAVEFAVIISSVILVSASD